MSDRRFLGLINPHFEPSTGGGQPRLEARLSSAVHSAIAGYAPTPLVSLPRLADDLGLGAVLVKDESERFGLGAFKALGASHAVARLMSRRWTEEFGQAIPAERFVEPEAVEPLGRFTFTTATDGNHGRALAWISRRLGQRAEIFLPAGSAGARIDAVRGEGARVTIVPGPYDAAVDACRALAESNGWQIVSDTSWPGYETIPRWVAEGYLTLFAEIDDQRAVSGHPAPDLVVVPGGVGTLAHAACDHLARVSPQTFVLVAEPIEAACLLESARSSSGSPVTASGRLETVMAGLNCGTPSLVAWKSIRARAGAFAAIGDAWAKEAVRVLATPAGHDPAVEAGESGAAGLAALLALARHAEAAPLRRRLDLGPGTTVLLLATEGPTDPRSWRRITGRRPTSVLSGRAEPK